MAIDTLSVTLTQALSWSAEKTVTSQRPVKHTGGVEKAKTVTAGTGADQADELHVSVRSIAAAGTDNIDLSAALTNVVNDPTVTVARVKGVFFWLLGAGDTVGPSGNQTTGNACSSITIGNHATQAFQGPLSAGATHTLDNGQAVAWVKPDATGWAVTGGSVDTIKVLNDDGSNTAEYVFGIAMASA